MEVGFTNRMATGWLDWEFLALWDAFGKNGGVEIRLYNTTRHDFRPMKCGGLADDCRCIGCGPCSSCIPIYNTPPHSMCTFLM
jgi:hypothetical protein